MSLSERCLVCKYSYAKILSEPMFSLQNTSCGKLEVSNTYRYSTLLLVPDRN